LRFASVEERHELVWNDKIWIHIKISRLF